MNNPFIWLIGIPLIASPLIYFSGHLVQRKLKVSLSQITALIALLVSWIPFVQTAIILQQWDFVFCRRDQFELRWDFPTTGRRHIGTGNAGGAVLPGLLEG